MDADMGLRVAVLGMGRWGNAWAEVIERHSGSVLAATAGGRGREGQGATEHFRDFRDALAFPDLDAVVITLPVHLHLEAVTLATSRGLHVLCEKPAVPDRAELHQLMEVASSTHQVIAVDQNYRERPWAEAVRQTLPRLGRIGHVSVSFAQPEFLDGGRDRLGHPLLADLAIHHIDLLRHLSGQEARLVSAVSGRPGWSTYDGDSDVAALFVMDDGASAAYHGTWSGRGRATPWDGDWMFRGEHGTLEVSGLEVTVDVGAGPRPIRQRGERGDNADLVRVWEQFALAIEGQLSRVVSVPDNAKSLSLVFDMADAVGLSPVGVY
jgi:predicted dehydrogenase